MDAEHSIIASSSQTSIPLPSTLFKIGEESRGASSINNHSTFNYVKLVKDILSEPLFNKLKSTFLGPIIKAGLRRGGGKQMGDGLGFSASLVHYLLVRQITTTKKDELWFYFNNQPMRFTLREFHLVTGLPCYAEDKIQVEENINWPMVTEKHTPEDLLAQLRALGNDDEESKLRLAMLLLLESIFLLKYALNKPSMYFKAEMLERGKNKMHTYPWGKLAFDLLVDSVHKLTGKLHTGSSKKDLKGFPMALLLWMLASVPALETAFAQSESDTSGFVCERYVVTRQPSYYEIESVAESTSPSVISFLGSDEEDYEDDDPFKMMMKMVKGGYPWTELDWRRGFILVEKAQQFIEVEKAQEDGGYASPRLETSVSLGLEASPRLETSVSLGLEASPRLSNSLHEPDTGDKDEFGKEDEDEQDEDEDVLVEDEDEDEQDEDVLVDQLKELNYQEQPEQEKVGVYKTRAGRVVKPRPIYSP